MKPDHDLTLHHGPAGDVPSAMAAADGMGTELRGLRERVASLKAQVFARAQISYAEGVLVSRYRLPGRREAFDVMRAASQQMNVKLHQLAAALAVTTAPDLSSAGPWFPARATPPAVPLTVLGQGRLDPRNQGEVLSAALRRVLEVTGGVMGNVQLYEGGILRLVGHRGHTQAFRDYFAFVEVEDGTACARAAVADRQVTVRDMITTPVFDEETRRVLLEAGSRACHSVPLAGTDGVVRGVISSHHDAPLASLDQGRLAALEELRHVVGGWLAWHRGTVVLDALEHLHQAATRHVPDGARRFGLRPGQETTGSWGSAVGDAEVMSSSRNTSADAMRQEAAEALEQAEANVAKLEGEIVQLKQAVASREEIGQAMGVLMAIAQMSPDDSWSVLREMSQRTNTKLRHVASLLIRWSGGGELPAEISSELDRQLRLRRSGLPGASTDAPGDGAVSAGPPRDGQVVPAPEGHESLVPRWDLSEMNRRVELVVGTAKELRSEARRLAAESRAMRKLRASQ